MSPTAGEYPILFTGEMVRALLAGNKTQTRRVVRPQPCPGGLVRHLIGEFYSRTAALVPNSTPLWEDLRCPYGKAGDHLYVRETWAPRGASPDISGESGARAVIEFQADLSREVFHHGPLPALADKWKPSIFQPRWASRIPLEVTSVRVERVNDITEVDAIAEGLTPWAGSIGAVSAREKYHSLWNRLNAKRGFGWDLNPWVWVIAFKKLTQ
jgi:hypothetical protein